MITLNLPTQPDPIKLKDKEILLVTNADMRQSANVTCWPIQEKFERKLTQVLHSLGYQIKPLKTKDQQEQHGFISSQYEGCQRLSSIDPETPIIVLLTAWQYSHHLAASLAHHKGPILLLANFDGTWPGLVGMLCLAGTLTALGCRYSRLWSEEFDDTFFFDGLKTWLFNGYVNHKTDYLHPINPSEHIFNRPEAEIGYQVGHSILKNKAIIGLFDSFCMGMINGVFPLPAMIKIGLPIESLSQSALLVEMNKIPNALKESCLKWYEQHGMTFKFGNNNETDLTREQVLTQCAMLIAMIHFVKRFGLSAIGVQYQQGLIDCCPASDFAEGAIGNGKRFPITDENGNLMIPDIAFPCINEVDMGSAIPQVMLCKLLTAMNLPAETTLHDIRWGSEYDGTFYWDFEISGAVPFAHLKNEIRGATGYRQPPMYFPLGGSTIAGQGKAGPFIWARAHYEGLDVVMHIGTGHAVELPEEEFQRRLHATTYQWPLMNAQLDGVNRNDLMAGHQSNHITIAYVDETMLKTVLIAFVAQALTQNIRVSVAGDAIKFFEE